MKRNLKAWLAATLLALAAPHALAATCSVSAVSLPFGSYNPFKATPTDTTGNIAVTCSGVAGEAVAYAIGLNSGTGTFAQRRMRSGIGSSLNYNIYTTAARTLIWGDGSGGSVVVSDGYTLGAPSVTRNYPVYGRTPALQKMPVQLYTDTIVVTLTF